jgi:hypothetical protein
MWPSHLKFAGKNAFWQYPYHLIWAPTKLGNMESCDHQIWNHMKKCCSMIIISYHLNNLPNRVIFRVMWPSDLKSHEKMLFHDYPYHLFEQTTKLGNIESCDYQMWNHMEKCCLTIPISADVNNLPNRVIFRVMWPSDLKSHEKMLFNNTHHVIWPLQDTPGALQVVITYWFEGYYYLLWFQRGRCGPS